MEAWLIILITISSGLVVLGLILFLKSRKTTRQPTFQTRVDVSSAMNNTIPSTNHSSVVNAGNPRNQTYMMTGYVPQQTHVYEHGYQQSVFQQQRGVNTQMYPQQQFQPQQQLQPQQQQFQPQPPFQPQQQFIPQQQHQPNRNMQNQQFYNSPGVRLSGQPSALGMM
jgi:hypothetical protein